jgi:hypothetical protein
MASATESETWRYPPNWLVDEILSRCSTFEVKCIRQVCREWRNDFTSRLTVLKPRSIKVTFHTGGGLKLQNIYGYLKDLPVTKLGFMPG